MGFRIEMGFFSPSPPLPRPLFSSSCWTKRPPPPPPVTSTTGGEEWLFFKWKRKGREGKPDGTFKLAKRDKSMSEEKKIVPFMRCGSSTSKHQMLRAESDTFPSFFLSKKVPSGTQEFFFCSTSANGFPSSSSSSFFLAFSSFKARAWLIEGRSLAIISLPSQPI